MKNLFRRLRNLTFEKLVNHFINFIYKKATLIVVIKKLDRLPRIQTPKLEVECRMLDSSYTHQISKLSNLDQEKINGFFEDGSKCLAAFYNDQLIAYVWCHYKDYYFPFFRYSLEVDHGVYIGPDFVAPKFRGNSLHGFLLTKLFTILFEEAYEYAWGSVLNNNYSSIKGLIRVGYIPQKQIVVIRILKTIVHKGISEIDQWYTLKSAKSKYSTLWQKTKVH